MPCSIIIPDTLLDEFTSFTTSLTKITQAKIIRQIDLLEEHGPILPFPHSKKIGYLLWELRVKGKQEVRIFFTIRTHQAILLHWFVKKTQKTPLKEIHIAHHRLQNIA